MSYDGFICYHSAHRSQVMIVADYVKNGHFRFFIDIEGLPAGSLHDQVIDQALKEALVLLVFIGPEGFGPWQQEEIFSAHWEAVKHSAKIIIPVILPGASIDHPDVPGFLKSRTYVKFEQNVEEEEPLGNLIKGILSAIGPVDIEKPVSQSDSEKLLEGTIKYYDNALRAERFYETWKNDIPRKKLDLLTRRLKRGAKILDAGCGPAHHASHLSQRGFDVTGIDLSRASLSIGGRTASVANKPTLLKMDMRNMSFERNTFDAIWASASCVHTPDAFLDRQLREFVRVLKPGGFLGITLQTSRVAAIEHDGRFFEGYKNQTELLRYFELQKLKIHECSIDITKKNTHGDRTVTEWIAWIVEVPEKERYVVR